MPVALPHTGSHTAEVTPYARGLGVRMIRPIVLFAGGIAIAFTGALHSDLGFDRILVAIVFIAFAAAQIIDWQAAPEGARARVGLVVAALAVVAAALQLIVATPTFFAAVIAAWALMTAVCDFLAGRALPATRGDANFLAAIGVVMAGLVLGFAGDPIAVIGFFGAYAVIAGVFLGISVFDAHSKAKREAAAEHAAAESAATASGALSESAANAGGAPVMKSSTPAPRSESTI